MSTAGISIERSVATTTRATWTLRIAIGFATTVAIWGICYFTLMGPGLAIGELLFALMLVVLAAGGAVGARCSRVEPRGVSAGVVEGGWVGFISALFNLLIFGSILSEGSTITEVVVWLVGLFVVSVGLGAAGGAFVSLRHPMRRLTAGSPLGLFASVLACSILLLLVSGGLVTGLEAGLAVPDWPGSFGHNMLLYPLRDMKGGIFFEHAHRLYGMLVGTGTITLLVLVFLNDRRNWLRLLSILLLLMVILQGFMGGYRVTELSIVLAMVHGVFGQVVFVTAAVLACTTTTLWTSSRPRLVTPSVMNDNPLALGFLVVVFLQLVLGACLRHLQVILPDASGIEIPGWAMYTHITVGVVAFVLALMTGLRAWNLYPGIRVIRSLGRLVVVIVSLQLLLGLLALLAILTRGSATPPTGEVIVTSMHQATGAVLFALAALLVLWYRRLLRGTPEA